MTTQTSKRYRAARQTVPEGKVDLAEAVRRVKGFAATKFDATVDLAIHLGIDPRQADQTLRGAFSMPHGIGKARRVVAFCDEADAAKAAEAGAVEAGGDELIKKIQDGWTDFDVAVATPAMMRSVSRLGRILGPQGKMPSPKSGTVVEDVASAVKEYSAGKVEYRNDDGGNLHVPVGKVSFEDRQLVENVTAFLDAVKRSRPPSVRGAFIRRVCLSATMSPSVDVDVG
jgi:large subunit ribosomal protein L1